MSESCRRRCPDPRRVLVALALALGCASPALACAVRLGPINSTPITYDPFVMAGAEARIWLEVALVEGDRCDVAVTLADQVGSPMRSLAFGNDGKLVFKLRLQPGLAVRESTDPADAMVTLTSDGPRAEVAWRLSVENDAVLAPGDYVVPVRVMVREPAQAAASIGAVALRSIARAQINLAGAAGSYEAGSDNTSIDLGELHDGSAGRAFLQLRANTAAHISFASKNRGYLANSESGTRIPYRFAFDGRSLDLSQPTTRSVDPPANIRGGSFELLVQVGSVAGAMAGRYSDSIVIDVSP